MKSKHPIVVINFRDSSDDSGFAPRTVHIHGEDGTVDLNDNVLTFLEHSFISQIAGIVSQYEQYLKEGQKEEVVEPAVSKKVGDIQVN